MFVRSCAKFQFAWHFDLEFLVFIKKTRAHTHIRARKKLVVHLLFLSESSWPTENFNFAGKALIKKVGTVVSS